MSSAQEVSDPAITPWPWNGAEYEQVYYQDRMAKAARTLKSNEVVRFAKFSRPDGAILTAAIYPVLGSSVYCRVGLASCSTEDRFDRWVGRNLALRRAKQAFPYAAPSGFPADGVVDNIAFIVSWACHRCGLVDWSRWIED